MEEPYTDYYIWADPKGIDKEGKPIPPNNWGLFLTFTKSLTSGKIVSYNYAYTVCICKLGISGYSA